MKPQYDWRAHPEIPAQLDRAVAAQAERLLAAPGAALLQPLALYLGTWKAEQSRTLLRKLIAEGTVRSPGPLSFPRSNSTLG